MIIRIYPRWPFVRSVYAACYRRDGGPQRGLITAHRQNVDNHYKITLRRLGEKEQQQTPKLQNSVEIK